MVLASRIMRIIPWPTLWYTVLRACADIVLPISNSLDRVHLHVLDILFGARLFESDKAVQARVALTIPLRHRANGGRSVFDDSCLAYLFNHEGKKRQTGVYDADGRFETGYQSDECRLFGVVLEIVIL